MSNTPHSHIFTLVLNLNLPRSRVASYYLRKPQPRQHWCEFHRAQDEMNSATHVSFRSSFYLGHRWSCNPHQRTHLCWLCHNTPILNKHRFYFCRLFYRPWIWCFSISFKRSIHNYMCVYIYIHTAQRSQIVLKWLQLAPHVLQCFASYAAKTQDCIQSADPVEYGCHLTLSFYNKREQNAAE